MLTVQILSYDEVLGLGLGVGLGATIRAPTPTPTPEPLPLPLPLSYDEVLASSSRLASGLIVKHEARSPSHAVARKIRP